jgi:hypothetical protein
MANPAEVILQALDRHLRQPAEIRLMGGAALLLAYGMNRTTEDADLLLDDAEFSFLVEQRDFGEVLEAANAELESLGLYVTHIWGPEQQILTPRWRESCRPIRPVPGLVHLRATALGPVDLILSKLCRADDPDLADMRYLLDREAIPADDIRQALREAIVPADFAEIFPVNSRKLEALLK